MANGDQSDIAGRLSSILPPSWFPAGSANETALLQGPAAVLSWCYSLIVAAKTQIRIATASGMFLDLMAFDFFGRAFMRRPGQSDASLSTGIRKELLRARGTRPAMVQALVDLTGVAPSIFEPTKPSDTGGYQNALGYGLAGGYGSMLMPFQCLLTAYRPATSGIPFAPGYGNSAGGYGIADEYASIANVVGAVTDAQIYARIASIASIGTVPWTQLLPSAPIAKTPPNKFAALISGLPTDFGALTTAPYEFADFGSCTATVSLVIDLGAGWLPSANYAIMISGVSANFGLITQAVGEVVDYGSLTMAVGTTIDLGVLT